MIKIGFFDSGSGAYDVEKSFSQELGSSMESIVYADYAHCPYGNKTPDEIRRLTTIGVEYLFQQGCHVVILACNTASVHSLRYLQSHLPSSQKILGVTYPACEAVRDMRKKNVVVFCTQATKDSGVYDEYIHKLAGIDVQIMSIAINGLVQAIESRDKPLQEKLIREALYNNNREIQTPVDAIILGCTHYPIISNIFQEITGELLRFAGSAIIDPGREAARRFLPWYTSKCANSITVNDSGMYLTDMPEREISKNFHQTLSSVELVPPHHSATLIPKRHG